MCRGVFSALISGLKTDAAALQVKKVKVLAKDVAAGLQVPVIKARLDELEKSYKDSHVSQVSLVYR